MNPDTPPAPLTPHDSLEWMACNLAMLCAVPARIVAERLVTLAKRPSHALTACYDAARAQLLAGREDGWAARFILTGEDDHERN